MNAGVFILQVLIALLTMMLMVSTYRSMNKQRDDMKKTLEWYADDENYHSAPMKNDFSEWEPPLIYRDNGKKARETLGRK